MTRDLSLIFLVALLAACTHSNTQSTPDQSAVAPVTAATVIQKEVPVDILAVGNVEAYSTITVKARIGGELTKVYFQEGDTVKQGDMLFLIDPRPYQEALRQAEANLARDTALLAQAEANLKRDVAQEKYARDQAQRYRKLLDEGVFSKEQAEQADTDARARAEALRADQAAIESARAAIQADRAAADDAKLQLNYCSIRSPIEGRTGNLAIKQGNLVKATDVDLVTINQIHPIYVTFSVPEKQLPAIKRHMGQGRLPVLVCVSGVDWNNCWGEESLAESDGQKPPGRPGSISGGAVRARGVLTFIDNAVDMATGTIRLKGTFSNTDGKLWPGQFVNVALRLTSIPNALVVPVETIQTGQQGNFVYVVRPDSTVDLRPVAVGARVGHEMVVERGLDAGETVVTEGQLRLAPGMKVRVKAAGGS